MAETLPDVRDDTLSDDEVEAGPMHRIDVKLQGADSEPYADFSLAKKLDSLGAPGLVNPTGKAKAKPKPRKMRKSVLIRPGRSAAVCEERYLPPGTMREYHVQYVRQSGLEKPASFPCFWRVSW